MSLAPIAMDTDNAVYVPGTTTPSSSIFDPVGEKVRKDINIDELSSSLNWSDDDNICALHMTHVKVYSRVFKVLRIPILILPKES